jgi:hypothetical protein
MVERGCILGILGGGRKQEERMRSKRVDLLKKLDELMDNAYAKYEKACNAVSADSPEYEKLCNAASTEYEKICNTVFPEYEKVRDAERRLCQVSEQFIKKLDELLAKV